MTAAAGTGMAWIDLAGRVAAVTGAAAGIGRAAAVALAGAGADVLLLDRDGAGADAAATAIRETGGTAEALALDVTDAPGWTGVRDRIEACHGRLDVLVNSAGIVAADRAGDDSLDTYRRIFAINVEGSLLGMATALHFMRRAGSGSIVNLGSGAALKGSAVMASYGANKAAIAHYTKSAALDAVRAGLDIRVNAVHPGVIDTAMADDFAGIFRAIGDKAQVMRATTTGRPGTAAEVADLIVFLASDRASFISGASIVIDRAQSA